VNFRVDTTPFDALAKDNWGHKVLRLLSPLESSIPYQGVAAVALQVTTCALATCLCVCVYPYTPIPHQGVAAVALQVIT